MRDRETTVNTIFEPECEEWADWRGTGRPNLTRDGTAETWRGTGRPNLSHKTKFSGANGVREIDILAIQLTTSRIGNLTRSIHTML